MNPVAGVSRVVDRVRRHDLTFTAAAVAYYGFVSILPIIVIGMTLLAALDLPVLTALFLRVAEEMLTPSLTRLAVETLTETHGQVGVTLTSLVVLLWSNFRLFRAIDIAFDRVYETDVDRSLGQQAADVLVTLGLVGGALVVTATIGVLVVEFDIPVVEQFGDGLLFLVLTATFLPLYYTVPDLQLRVVEALPGCLVAAGVWVALQALLRLYLAHAARFALYGVFGVALLVLTWFYVGALALLLGATVNAVVAR